MMGLKIMCLVLKRSVSVHAVFMPGNVDLEQAFFVPMESLVELIAS